MVHNSTGPELGRSTQTRTRVLLALAGAGALVVASAVGAAYGAWAARSGQAKAIAAVVGSGVMTSTPQGFKPNAPATRGQLAQALLRSMPRVAFTSVGTSAPAAGSVELGAVRLKIDGDPGKPQAVLLTFNGQLDHDTALAAGCFPVSP